MATTRKSNAGSGVAGNPYGIARNDDPNAVQEYPDSLDPAYAVPSPGAPYSDPGAPWAESIRTGIGTTPDAQRERQAPIYSQRADPVQPQAFYQRLDADTVARTAADTVTPLREQITEQVDPLAQLGVQRWAPDPRRTPIAAVRPTETLSPSTYGGYTRDMSGRTPHRLNGNHFSMADHRRMDAEIFGMQPPTAQRSTQRLDTLPWGTNVVNQAPQTNYPNEAYDAPVSPLPTNSSYRLG